MIHLEVVVADTAELLGAEPNGYGAGALLRWASSATIDGTYVEGGTVALVTGQSVYDIWDVDGVVGTWYKTQISNAAGSTFSSFTIPFQVAEQGLYLSAAQVRAFNIGGDLGDEPLLILLAAATQDIRRAAGPMGPVTEMQTAGAGDLLLMGGTPLSITSVVETVGWSDVTLSADDYQVIGARTLLRLHTGTNPCRWWRGRVSVTYQPQDDLAARQRVQLALVKLDITHSPGLAAQTIGTWSEQYTSNSAFNYEVERAAILASLGAGEAGIR